MLNQEAIDARIQETLIRSAAPLCTLNDCSKLKFRKKSWRRVFFHFSAITLLGLQPWLGILHLPGASLWSCEIETKFRPVSILLDIVGVCRLAFAGFSSSCSLADGSVILPGDGVGHTIARRFNARWGFKTFHSNITGGFYQILPLGLSIAGELIRERSDVQGLRSERPITKH